jgi:hypothetical protein
MPADSFTVKIVTGLAGGLFGSFASTFSSFIDPANAISIFYTPSALVY